LQGFQQTNAPYEEAAVNFLSFEQGVTNWTIRMGVTSISGFTLNPNYIISFYSK